MSAKHTPTPWEVSHFGDIVGDHDNDGYVVVAKTPAPNSPPGSARRNTWNDNAALIVRAVNAHDDLVAAADEALNVFIGCCVPMGGADDRNAILRVQGLLRAALAKAEAL